MIEIVLTQGKVALIDDEDYLLVYQYKWCAHKENQSYYALSSPTRKQIRMHRIIMKTSSSQWVDHINGDGLDNRRCNLRICNREENQRNRRKHKIGHSKYKGVSKKFNTTNKIWCSSITIKGKEIFLGMFETEIEAALVYDKASRKYFKEFANYNIKQEMTRT